MDLLFFWVISGLVGAIILSRYRKAGTGCLLGLLLGPIGWIIAFVMRGNAKAEEDERRHQTLVATMRAEPGTVAPRPERECPHCAELILARAKVCKHCGAEVLPVLQEWIDYSDRLADLSSTQQAEEINRLDRQPRAEFERSWKILGHAPVDETASQDDEVLPPKTSLISNPKFYLLLIVAFAVLVLFVLSMRETKSSKEVEAESRPPVSSKDYTITSRPGSVVVFVAIKANETVERKRLRRIAREVCGSRQVCAVKFWLSEADAARTLPMSTQEVNSIYAAYHVSRHTGRDDFTCHPFGAPGQQCARMEDEARPSTSRLISETTGELPFGLIGEWTLDPEFGTYEHRIQVRADGRHITTIAGSSFEANWRELPGGRFGMEPYRADEYYVIRAGRLESHDAEGLIRKFRRSGKQPATAPKARPNRAAKPVVPSSLPSPETPEARKERARASAQILQRMQDQTSQPTPDVAKLERDVERLSSNGFLIRLDVARNQAEVDRVFWQSAKLSIRMNVARTLAEYCYAKGGENQIVIFEAESGKHLAGYSPYRGYSGSPS